MTDNNPDKLVIAFGAAAGAELVKQSYDDLGKPAARHFARTMEGLSWLVNLPSVFLTKAMNSFGPAIDDWMMGDVRNAVNEIPHEHLQHANVRIVHGVIAQIPQFIDDDSLRYLFAQLMAAASDQRRANKVHPSYASVLAQLDPLDATVLQHMRSVTLSGSDSSDWGAQYELESEFSKCVGELGFEGAASGRTLDNLLRLRLLAIRMTTEVEYVEGGWSDRYGIYNPSVKASFNAALELTDFGAGILDICTVPEETQPATL